MPSIIEDLRDPKSLPDPTGAVKPLQTHISLVFTADEFVSFRLMHLHVDTTSDREDEWSVIGKALRS